MLGACSAVLVPQKSREHVCSAAGRPRGRRGVAGDARCELPVPGEGIAHPEHVVNPRQPQKRECECHAIALSVDQVRRKIRAQKTSKRLSCPAPGDLSVFGMPVVIGLPLIPEATLEGYRARLMARVGLPRHAGRLGAQYSQPLVVQLVPKEWPDRCAQDELEKLAVIKRQMELDTIEIDVLEVLRQVPALIVQHQKEMQGTPAGRPRKSVDFLAHAIDVPLAGTTAKTGGHGLVRGSREPVETEERFNSPIDVPA